MYKRDGDSVSGRFALLEIAQDSPGQHNDKASSSSKRRRRKSAKASINHRTSSEEITTAFTGSSVQTKLPLRTVSELDVLRSNSADASSSLDAAIPVILPSAGIERHTDADVPQHIPRRPQASLSFQESNRPLAESKSKPGIQRSTKKPNFVSEAHSCCTGPSAQKASKPPFIVLPSTTGRSCSCKCNKRMDCYASGFIQPCFADMEPHLIHAL